MLSVKVLTFRHLILLKDIFVQFRLIIFQTLLGTVLLYSLCCNTRKSLSEAIMLRHNILKGISRRIAC